MDAIWLKLSSQNSRSRNHGNGGDFTPPGCAPPKPDKWSPKQELGHLIDSAINNHRRIVRAQLEENPAMPGYDADKWVELHRYQQREWNELIQIWHEGNSQIVAATDSVTKAGWLRTLSVNASAPMTLLR